MTSSHPLREQLDYYRARAPEYDEWWFRQGRYDRGEESNGLWFQDVRRLEEKLRFFQPAGRVLELACGTGLWTRRLMEYATELTAVDGSPEMLEVNAARCHAGTDKVRYIQVDLFQWEPPEAQFDTIFFAFWLSHVPPEKFTDFWDRVHRSLAPGGRVLFFDSLHEPAATASDHLLPSPEVVTLQRRLNDGRSFTIYKVFHQPAELREKLRALGWEAFVNDVGRHFLAGECRLAKT